MNTYIALLRGINVGGKNILSMKDLISIFATLNYENIKTYIQSGNVVFQSRKKVDQKAAVEISTLVKEKRGFEPKVLILKADELKIAIANNPFPTADGKALHFYFLESQTNQPNMERLMSLKSESEEFELIHKVFYLYAPLGIGRSKLASEIEKALGIPVSARNWNTVNKILSLVENAS